MSISLGCLDYATERCEVPVSNLIGEQTFMLCWVGNHDALIYGSKLYLTRVFDIVSLKLFYNYGRLPWIYTYGTGGGERGRVVDRQLDYDRDWVQTEQGFHCKLCGRPLKEVNARLRKFCPEHEIPFWHQFIQHSSWSGFREKVYERDKGKCVKCSKEIGDFWDPWVCDHIVPLCKGGVDWLDDPEMTNFQTLCPECNRVKTALDCAKPKVVRGKHGVEKTVFLGWVFEKANSVDHQLEKFFPTVNSLENGEFIMEK